MARRHASLALTAVLLAARLAGGGVGTAAANVTDESIRTAVAHHHTPSRWIRSHQGATARHAARQASLGAWMATIPIAFEEPPRTIAPPPVRALASPISVLPPPSSHARAPPR